jgi:hypothetical protein
MPALEATGWYDLPDEPLHDEHHPTPARFIWRVGEIPVVDYSETVQNPDWVPEDVERPLTHAQRQNIIRALLRMQFIEFDRYTPYQYRPKAARRGAWDTPVVMERGLQVFRFRQRAFSLN